MSSKGKPKRPNAVRRIMEREESRERRVREASIASNGGASHGTTPTAAAPPKPNRPKCANPKCPKPNVVDGTCQTCGMVADDSNIVSEITFGESSSGAAVVHGTHVAFDQGGIRGVGGLAFRRVAGGGASEARERSLREVKALLQQYSYQLRTGQSINDIAFRYYKACSHGNFVQGRKKQNVAAICLYAACRAENNHKIMLIDLADMLKVDVFALGRGYKDFLQRFPEFLTGPRPIVIEDLIFRFASKLEFLRDTNKVAESAVRIAKRMQHDNITHGRRPAGICGAALIMAARAHNYRRTVREVVYIVKVTMATLQERMDEFASVPAAQLTVQDFHDKDPLEAGPAHDPPFVYKQTDEWKAKHTRPKKRKRKEAGDGKTKGAKKMRTSDGSAAAAPTVDKDGFVVPPVPRQEGESDPEVETEALIVTAVSGEEQQLSTLVEEYGELDEEEDDSDFDLESDDDEEEVDPSSEVAFAKAQGVDIAASGASASNGETAGKQGEKKKRGGKKARKITMPITQEWQTDEALLEKEMEGHLHDPEFLNAAQAEDNRSKREKAAEERREKLREQKRMKKEQASAAAAAAATASASASASGSSAPASSASTTSSAATPAPDSTPATTSESTTNPSPTPTSTDQPNANKTDTVMADAPVQEGPKTSGPERLDPSAPYTRPQFVFNTALDDPIVHEDEFADDPEVMYCRLGEAEAKMKEQIWVNIHVDFLRAKQQRVFDQKLAEKNKGPNKRKNKKNRAHEDNNGVPQTAEEAAANMMRNRGISTKLDYSKLGQIFDVDFNEGPGSREADSEQASEAGDATEERSNERRDSAGTAAAAVEKSPAPEEEPVEEEEVEEPAPEEDFEEEYNEHEAGYDDYDEGGEEDINPFADDDDVEDEDEY